MFRIDKENKMAKILCIDTSAEVCSVVLGDETGVKYERVSYEGRDHSIKAGSFANEILQEAKNDNFWPIDAVVVCSGPGSYTGLRIGVSLAKGLCYGYNVPLIALDSLQVMARDVVKSGVVPLGALLCPMIDARRMEVYSSIFDANMNMKQEAEAVIIDEDSFSAYSDKPFYIFGTGAEKCAETLPWCNFVADIYPMAHSLLEPAIEAFSLEKFEDLAYFEPFYLKQFQTTTSKKKLF